MNKYTMLSTVMAAMLLIPAMAMAEEKAAPAADAPATVAAEAPADGHGMMMHKKGQAAFEEADSNKDGALSLDEFLERHKIKFTEIDADKNGSLSQDEMKIYGETHREKMKDRWEGRKERSMDKEMLEKQIDKTTKPAQ